MLFYAKLCAKSEKYKPGKSIHKTLDHIFSQYLSLKGHYNHARHLAKISVQFLQATGTIHGLTGEHWLKIMYCAGFAHDIGKAEEWGNNHDQASFELICRNNNVLNDILSKKEIRITALCALYHNNLNPGEEDPLLYELNEIEVYAVKILSSLLKMADRLDQEKNQNLKRISCYADEQEKILYVYLKRKKNVPPGGIIIDQNVFRKRMTEKSALWMKLTGYKPVFIEAGKARENQNIL